MTRDQIDDVVCSIMRHDGPDRHVDGHEVITDFIMALLSGRGPHWVLDYANRIEKRRRAE